LRSELTYHFSLPIGTTLAEALIGLGTEVTADPEVILATFRRFGFSESSPPTESTILDLFTALSSVASEGEQLCDITSLIKTLIAMVSKPMVLNELSSSDICSQLLSRGLNL
jgi:hypothetical protein